MYIDSLDYNRTELLKFFNKEYIWEDEAQIISYFFSTDEFKFSLFLSIYDNLSVIRLIINQSSQTIFEIPMKNITKITCNETSLFFIRAKNLK